jgi:anti-sigma regulatory factor (Ser/Thr protein kinase)
MLLSGSRVIGRKDGAWVQFLGKFLVPLTVAAIVVVMALLLATQIRKNAQIHAAESAASLMYSVLSPVIGNRDDWHKLENANPGSLTRLVGQSATERGYALELWDSEKHLRLSIGSSKEAEFPFSQDLVDLQKEAVTGPIHFEPASEITQRYEHYTDPVHVMVPVGDRTGGGSHGYVHIVFASDTLASQVWSTQVIFWSALIALSALSMVLLWVSKPTLKTEAVSRVAQTQESSDTSIKSDLHDGPVQLLSLALHKLNDESKVETCSWSARNLVQEALTEVRDICAGNPFPCIERINLRQTLLLAVSRHEQMTMTEVRLDVPAQLPDCPMKQRIALFRFVQEALNNSYQHASGRGQSVSVSYCAEHVRISVSDQGPGFDAEMRGKLLNHFGLRGMKNRITECGGELSIASSPGSGTVVTAKLPQTKPLSVLHH